MRHIKRITIGALPVLISIHIVTSIISIFIAISLGFPSETVPAKLSLYFIIPYILFGCVYSLISKESLNKLSTLFLYPLIFSLFLFFIWIFCYIMRDAHGVWALYLLVNLPGCIVIKGLFNVPDIQSWQGIFTVIVPSLAFFIGTSPRFFSKIKIV